MKGREGEWDGSDIAATKHIVRNVVCECVYKCVMYRKECVYYIHINSMCI